MVYFVMEPSLPGFYSALYAAFKTTPPPDQIVAVMPSQVSLFTQTIEIPLDQAHAEAFCRGVIKTAGPLTMETLDALFYSDRDDAGTLAFRYTRQALALGVHVNDCMYINEVHDAVMTRHKVTFESHRLKGLIRFELLQEGILYSRIDPDHFVLPYLAPHFADRLGNRRWILHDQTRECAVLCENGHWAIISLPRTQELQLHPTEMAFQQLWQCYYDTISIQERTNLALQRRFVPIRYRKNLTEFQAHS